MAEARPTPISKLDRSYISRVVQTEVGSPNSPFAKKNPEQYNRMVQGVVDTMVNRTVSPSFPGSIEGVANQRRQFSKITGPSYLDPWGSVQNTPDADPKLQRQVTNYVGDLMAGNPETFAGSVNYLNPYQSDASNMKAWGQSVVDQDQPAGAGGFVHYHGTAPGSVSATGRPTGELGDFQDVSRSQVGIGLGMAGPRSADAIDRADERGSNIYGRMMDTPSPSYMSQAASAVGAVPGNAITGAMRAWNGIGGALGTAFGSVNPFSDRAPASTAPTSPQSYGGPMAAADNARFGGTAPAPGQVTSSPLAAPATPSYTPSTMAGPDLAAARATPTYRTVNQINPAYTAAMAAQAQAQSYDPLAAANVPSLATAFSAPTIDSMTPAPQKVPPKYIQQRVPIAPPRPAATQSGGGYVPGNWGATMANIGAMDNSVANAAANFGPAPAGFSMPGQAAPVGLLGGLLSGSNLGGYQSGTSRAYGNQTYGTRSIGGGGGSTLGGGDGHRAL